MRARTIECLRRLIDLLVRLRPPYESFEVVRIDLQCTRTVADHVFVVWRTLRERERERERERASTHSSVSSALTPSAASRPYNTSTHQLQLGGGAVRVEHCQLGVLWRCRVDSVRVAFDREQPLACGVVAVAVVLEGASLRQVLLNLLGAPRLLDDLQLISGCRGICRVVGAGGGAAGVGSCSRARRVLVLARRWRR